MTTLEGKCRCGNLGYRAGLCKPPQHLQPRRCDCGFCTALGAAYVSDPGGTLKFWLRDPAQLLRQKQTDQGQAEFLLCAICGQLGGVVYQTWGALQSSLAPVEWGPLLEVSPRLLSSDERVARWKQLWFPDVQVERQ